MLARLLLIALICPWLQAEALPPKLGSKPVDQLKHSKQACGPAALLNQFRFGDRDWSRAGERIPVQGDTRQLRWVIGRYGHKLSAHLHKQRRFNPASGVNVADLIDMLADMRNELATPKQRLAHLQRTPADRGHELIKRTHRLIQKSLKKGTPPILQLRRVVRRTLPSSGRSIWSGIHGHFVVIIAVQTKLSEDSTGFELTYIDPWRGRILEGRLQIPRQRFYANNPDAENAGAYQLTPYLVADFPYTPAGLHRVRRGEATQLTTPNLIGEF